MADSNIVTAVTQVPGVTDIIQMPQNAGESITVSGTITGRDANGNFLLRTQNGNLTLHSNFPLTYNSDVVLRLSNNGPQGTSARIVSVNGEAFSQFAQPDETQTDSVSNPLSADQPILQTAGAQIAEANAQASNPDAIPAVIISSPSDIADNSPQAPVQVPTQATNPTPAQLPPSGSAVVINIAPAAAAPAQATAPVAGQNPTALPQQAAGQSAPTPQPGQQTATALVENTAEVPSPQLPVQQANLNTTNANQTVTAKTTQPVHAAPTQVQLQGAITEDAVEETAQSTPSPLYAAYARQIANAPQQPQAEQAAPSTSAANALPARLAPVQGQVISASESGTVKIQTAAGEVTVQVNTAAQLFKLQPGATVTIEFPQSTPDTAQVPAQPVLSGAPASFAQIAASWDTLKAIVNLLSNTDNAPGMSETAPASSLLANIPALGSSFSASSLSFIAALSSGDANKILGEDTVNNLKSSGQSALLQRFSAEVTTLLGTLTAARPASQPPIWQTTFLPFFYQGELQQARIYVKRDAQNKKQQAGVSSTGGTRFIVEVDMSELGGVQIDGLIRKKQSNTIFDLLIRSHTEFTPQEKVEMAMIYNNAAQVTGFSGSLGFQVTNDFPVKPLDEILANQNNSIVA